MKTQASLGVRKDRKVLRARNGVIERGFYSDYGG